MATQILMPALSPTMEEGKLSKWLVKEGDEVHSGDILAEIETDKATMEFEAVDEGHIAKILVPEGTEGVKVNQPIAVLLGENEDASAAATPTPSALVDISSAMASIKDAVSEEAGTATSPAKAEATRPTDERNVSSTELGRGRGEGMSKEPAVSEQKSNGRIFVSPLAKRMAAKAGVELSSVRGSGPRGRIVKSDIEAAEKSSAAKTRAEAAAPGIAARGEMAVVSGIAPLPDAKLFFKPEDYEEIPHDSMRKSIAKRLSSAKTLIPHYYLTIDCNIDRLLDARARLNERSPKDGGAYKLSVNDFIVKACALALIRFPEVNSSWTESSILRHRHADVGVAVALDFGLITPIVFRAEEKGLAQISNEVKSLAERARTKKLKPQEFEGGTFAVSNLGMFGVRDFTAVINPPHAAILAVGAGEQRAVVRDGKIEAATLMAVTMSCDHRVIDGATGARFLQAFKAFVEEPASMLL
ncbi:MAG TPA: pyruvate dehydrogenase complex dihydrolipoamide acetyltransferase [Rhizomicrobium sp.]|jgi:pyruvate dehydrogenase E2 component (dihydrolipoamide acetyltransferase)|nr:pyruvate dehydrogenase complex dihydrolipoamide acetyltransferase [Rhizomicrobium sp.]